MSALTKNAASLRTTLNWKAPLSFPSSTSTGGGRVSAVPVTQLNQAARGADGGGISNWSFRLVPSTACHTHFRKASTHPEREWQGNVSKLASHQTPGLRARCLHLSTLFSIISYFSNFITIAVWQPGVSPAFGPFRSSVYGCRIAEGIPRSAASGALTVLDPGNLLAVRRD